MYNLHLTFAQFFKHKDLAPYLFLLSKKMSDGHICIPTTLPEDEETKSLFSHIKPFEQIEAPHLIGTPTDILKPFIVYNQQLYTQRYYQYETQVFDFITSRTQQQDNSRSLVFTNAHIQALFGYSDAHETNWQAVAAVNAAIQNFSIITGGPGTGKTTTIARLLSLLYKINPSTKVAIAAPTGKASARMSESLQLAAHKFDQATQEFFKKLTPNTLHRLLGYKPNSINYKHNKENPLPYDVVIIDESSMIDMAMFAKLTAAIAPHTKLILLGDKDQLASVEAGSILGDICQSVELNAFTSEHLSMLNQFDLINSQDEKYTAQKLSNHIVALQKSHRFSADSGIGKLAKAIIESNISAIQPFIQNEDESIVFHTEENDAFIKSFAEKYIAYIKKKDTFEALKEMNRFKILCAVKQGSYGVHTINNIVEQHLAQKQLINRDDSFYTNMPILITQNDYNLGLYNGDIGIVRPDKDGVLKVWFIASEEDKTLKSVLPGFILNYEKVYAMTIHKSQGSEFDEVLMVLPSNEDMNLLTKELLYTGVTRTKQKMYIQCNAAIFLQGSSQAVSRSSGLKERFKAL